MTMVFHVDVDGIQNIEEMDDTWDLNPALSLDSQEEDDDYKISNKINACKGVSSLDDSEQLTSRWRISASARAWEKCNPPMKLKIAREHSHHQRPAGKNIIPGLFSGSSAAVLTSSFSSSLSPGSMPLRKCTLNRQQVATVARRRKYLDDESFIGKEGVELFKIYHATPRNMANGDQNWWNNVSPKEPLRAPWPPEFDCLEDFGADKCVHADETTSRVYLDKKHEKLQNRTEELEQNVRELRDKDALEVLPALACPVAEHADSSRCDTTSVSSTSTLEAIPKRKITLKWSTNHEDAVQHRSDWMIVVVTVSPHSNTTETYHVHKFVLGYGPRASFFFRNEFRHAAGESMMDRENHDDESNYSIIELDAPSASLFPEMLDFIYSLRTPSGKSLPVFERMDPRRRSTLSQLGKRLGVKGLSEAMDDSP